MRSNAFCIYADCQLSFSIKIYIRQGRIRPNSAKICAYVVHTFVFCMQFIPSSLLKFSDCNLTSRQAHYISKWLPRRSFRTFLWILRISAKILILIISFMHYMMVNEWSDHFKTYYICKVEFRDTITLFHMTIQWDQIPSV